MAGKDSVNLIGDSQTLHVISKVVCFSVTNQNIVLLAIILCCVRIYEQQRIYLLSFRLPDISAPVAWLFLLRGPKHIKIQYQKTPS